ncbi:MAG: EF-P lysine aminoacylase EpmA [Fuerstiella sp.]|nr:EF-P lysine aminoacylase EpmA [Fuerstiella sp.]
MSLGATNWKPGCSIEMIQLRACLQQCIRDFFSDHAYMEVETPLLSHDVIIDANLDPFELSVAGERMYLQTSPEAAMKRLLAAGSGSIFQITKSFRAAERGVLHNPEFTMVEWYGLETSWRDQIAITEQLIRRAADCISEQFPTQLSPNQFEVTTYQQAFATILNIDALTAPTGQLQKYVADIQPGSAMPDDRDDLLNLLLAAKIEPRLGRRGPEFLIDYPVSQAALAETSEDDPRVARRFELYVSGTEICNGYQELTNPEELHWRNIRAMARRRQLNLTPLSGAPGLMSAMLSGLPHCSGVALGFDRLLMVLSGCNSLDECLPFPIERA